MTESTGSNFPVIYGTEEETRPLVYAGLDARNREHGSLGDRQREILEDIWAEVGLQEKGLGFMRNGGRVYADNGIEIATSETSSPQACLRYIRADNEIIIDGLSRYIVNQAKTEGVPYTAELPRRVVDSHGVTWGCHDNFSYEPDEYYVSDLMNRNRPLHQLWDAFLRSRPFMTGAGYATDSGFHYSQKLSAYTVFSKYGASPSLLRVDSEHGNRFEIRCSDINLRAPAILNRLGGAALVLAASQTKLVRDIVRTGNKKSLFSGNYTNRFWLDDDLSLRSFSGAQRTIDIQRHILSTILEQYSDGPIPDNLRTIGEACLSFCDDFEAVVAGRKDFSDLAGRADWAMKLHYTREGIVRKNIAPERISAYAQGVDQLYDRTVLRAAPSGTLTRHDGFGLRLADEAYPIPELEAAKSTPPQDSRAAKRVSLAYEHGNDVTHIDWHTLTIEKNRKEKVIELPVRAA